MSKESGGEGRTSGRSMSWPVKRWSLAAQADGEGLVPVLAVRMAAKAIGKSGVVFYAMPAGITTRSPMRTS